MKEPSDFVTLVGKWFIWLRRNGKLEVFSGKRREAGNEIAVDKDESWEKYK